MTREELLHALHSIPVKTNVTELTCEGSIECLYATSKGTKEEWIGLDEWPALVYKNASHEPITYHLKINGETRTFTDYQSFAESFEKDWIGDVTPWEDYDDNTLEAWLDDLEFYEDIYVPAFLDMKCFLNCQANSVSMDWKAIEDELGFPLHDGLKEYYTKIFSFDDARGFVVLPKDFLIPTGDEKADYLLSDLNDKIVFTLFVIPHEELAIPYIEEAFDKGGCGNKSTNRFLIGTLTFDVETDIFVLFNNDTGYVELHNAYEESPNEQIGLIAKSMDEFLEKLGEILV